MRTDVLTKDELDAEAAADRYVTERKSRGLTTSDMERQDFAAAYLEAKAEFGKSRS